MSILMFTSKYFFVWFLLGVGLVYAWLFLDMTHNLTKLLISKNGK